MGSSFHVGHYNINFFSNEQHTPIVPQSDRNQQHMLLLYHNLRLIHINFAFEKYFSLLKPHPANKDVCTIQVYD